MLLLNPIVFVIVSINDVNFLLFLLENGAGMILGHALYGFLGLVKHIFRFMELKLVVVFQEILLFIELSLPDPFNFIHILSASL
jgi:hypothetical protein